MAACMNSKRGVWMGILTVGIFLPAVLFKFSAGAVIIEGPANHTVPIGATVTFHCIVQGEDAFLEINNTAINYPEDEAPFTERGFKFSEAINYDTSTYNFTVTVNALPGNNNTRITCLVYPLDYHSGRLTVMGPPSPPEPQLLVLNATTIQLSWLPPFSWEDYPIVNYTVQVHNRITGEVINSTVNVTFTETVSAAVTREVMNSTLNTTSTEAGSATITGPATITGSATITDEEITDEEINSTINAASTSTTTAPVTYIHNAPHVGVVQNCEELVFSVFAANNIGWGSPAVVTGGFPIVPRLNITSIETMVTFQFDGTPLLRLNIQLPGICPFQELSYKITIQQISPTHNTISTAGQAENIVLIGPKTVTGHRNVYEVVNSSLVVDAVYSVLVEFDTLAGNVSSSATFGTRFQPTPKYTDATSGGISLVGKVVIGVSVGLISFVAVTIMLLVLCGFKFCKHSSDNSSIEKACDAMVPNPIYEGPLYETIHSEFKSLTSLPPAPVVMEPPRYLPIRQALPSEVARALQDGTAIAVASEPSQRSGEEIKEGRPLSGKNEDDYTVMSPVGTLSSSLHGGWCIPTSESP